ncbi:MAG: cation:dicarboxylase symporter family transporter [Solobacterium sp.]|nr:cation:dicarboxylase symporter family transporter [Solobacterium sp.]
MIKFFMNRININEDIELTGASLDHISEIIADFLLQMRMENSSRLRVRLSMEEAMLRWMDHFGNGVPVHLEIGVILNRPTITLTLSGEQFNPLVSSENDLGEWAESLFTGISLSPTYAYRRGVNILQLKMSMPEHNPALKLLMAVMIGGSIGILGKMIIPNEIMSRIVYTILDPIQGVFLRMLNVTSGPVIFLSVITTTCAVGSMTAIGKSGRRMTLRFITITLIATLISAVVMLKPLSIHLAQTLFDESQFSSVLDLLLQAIPNDAFTPIITGNSPQMILIALVLGNALLAAGPKASRLQTIIEQADTVGLIIADWVSRLTPFFVTVLLILGIWNGSVNILLGLWLPLLSITILSLIAMSISVLRISTSKQVPVRVLIEKMKPSFLIAFRNSSVDASITENMNCCENKLGISKKLTSFGIPLGLISFMPAEGISTMVLLLYAASVYKVSVSIVWLFIAIALTVALTAATPPVSGIGILTYTVLFAQLHIPSSALTMAMVADILIGFIVIPMNQAMLQMELVTEADTLDLLNRDILRAEPMKPVKSEK